MNIKLEKCADEGGRATRSSVDDVKNARRDLSGRFSIFREVSKSRADRETEHLDFSGRHAAISDDGSALFVGDDKVIGRRAVPNRVNCDRIRDDGDVFAALFTSQDLLQQIGIGWKRRNNDIRLEAVEQAAEIFLEAAESLESFIEIFFAIEPVVNVAPRFRPAVDQGQVRAPDNFVERAKRFREQIAEFDFDLWSDPRQPGANTARSAVVTLAKSGGEDQNSFHDSLGQHRNDSS